MELGSEIVRCEGKNLFDFFSDTSKVKVLLL